MSTNELLPSGSTFSSQTLTRLSIGAQKQTRREVEQVQRRAIVAKLTVDGRGFLANTALEHAGALTALEQHLITVAPLGEARYREIVDSYTLGASAAIRRWH